MPTPWGADDSLRDRRLRPGPGTPREEVVANQRERLFGAMVASVGERGYQATTVGDLASISGVSSRTFYELFPDKKACFLATLEAGIEAAIAFAARRAGEPLDAPAPSGVALPARDPGDGSWEESAWKALRAFAEMIVPSRGRPGWRCSRPTPSDRRRWRRWNRRWPASNGWPGR